jgi:hypothetical protein
MASEREELIARLCKKNFCHCTACKNRFGEAYDSGYRARDAEVAALRQALAHVLYRNHPESDGCDACVQTRSILVLAQTKPATKETTK